MPADWIKESAVRARELGQVQHVEVFVVPQTGTMSMERLQEVERQIYDIDWKVYDVVVVPVPELPDYFDSTVH